MIESLESRQLMAANPYLDTSFNTTGVSTIRFRVPAGDTISGASRITQLVNTPGDETYVMARSQSAAMVIRLNVNGTVDTGFGRNGQLSLPISGSNDSVKIASDSVGNLVMLAGKTIYRFDGQGKSLNTAFANNGALTLTDFTGQIDMQVDAANKIYVTGTTKKKDGLLVERFISRGKLDKTFSGDGIVNVPIASSATKIGSATASGQYIGIVDNSAADTLDDDLVVAGSLTAAGYGTGAQSVKLNYDGSLDTSYGKQGYMAVLASPPTDLSTSSITVNGIGEDGRVSLVGYTFDSLGSGSSSNTVTVSTAGIRQEADAAFSTAYSNDDGGYLGLYSGELQRFLADNTAPASFNDGQRLTGISSFVQDANGYVKVLGFTSGNVVGKVNVLKFTPGINPGNNA